MTYEETRKLLEQIKREKYYVQKAQEELAELICTYQNLTFSPSGVSIKSTKISKPVESALLKITEAQDKYSKEWQTVFELIDKVQDSLMQLPIEQRNILQDYYIRGKSVVFMASKYIYSERSVYNVIYKGIRSLSKII